MEHQFTRHAETHEAEPYEPQDFQPRPLFKLGMVFVLAMAVVAGIVIGEQILFSGLRPDFSAAPPLISNAAQVPPPPAPQLQPVPAADLQQFRAREDSILRTYGWVDQKNGVLRIPIDRAMDLLLQRGLPVQIGQSFRDDGTQSANDANGGRSMESAGQ